MITFKEFTFEAAHQIPPFSTVHGHTFRVELSFAGQCDPKFGWAVSLDDLCKEVDVIRAEIDHKYLNDIPGLEVPSLENVASWLWNRISASLPNLSRVMVTRGFQGQAEGCIYEGPASLRAKAA